MSWYVQYHIDIENNVFSYPSLLNITSISERHMYIFVKKKCTKTFRKQNRRMIHEYIQRIDENVEMYNCISIEYMGII